MRCTSLHASSESESESESASLSLSLSASQMSYCASTRTPWQVVLRDGLPKAALGKMQKSELIDWLGTR